MSIVGSCPGSRRPPASQGPFRNPSLVLTCPCPPHHCPPLSRIPHHDTRLKKGFYSVIKFIVCSIASLLPSPPMASVCGERSDAYGAWASTRWVLVEWASVINPPSSCTHTHTHTHTHTDSPIAVQVRLCTMNMVISVVDFSV